MELSPRRLEPNPALVRQADQRAKSIENRVADRITAFAGSTMPFVYIHILWFGCWIGFGVENYPYGRSHHPAAGRGRACSPRGAADPVRIGAAVYGALLAESAVGVHESGRPPRQQRTAAWHWFGIALRQPSSQIHYPREEMR